MEELIENICEYIKKPYTDYAIMINGEWGSGKTFFWNNKLRKRLESIKVNGKNYKTIYMSLYGINSLDEISKKIFIETNPTMNRTLKKVSDAREGNIIPEYVKTGLDMANFFGNFSFSPDRIDFAKNFSVDDKILCFDDLERANVDVIDILGYINNFVEHDGIKTILICNEKELAIKFKNKNIELKTMIAAYILDKKDALVKNTSDKPLSNVIENEISEIFEKSNDYERIKEKLIGETFEYIPEYAYILSGMILKYSYNDKLSEFLKKNTSVIISAFKKSNTKNLRILKHALNDFEKIYDNVLLKYEDINIDILRTMLTFDLAISFEIKSGSASKEKLKDISSNEEYMSLLYTSNLLNDTDNFYLREFDHKYFENNFSKYKFFKFIEVYIRTRYLDEKLLKEDIENAMDSLKEEKKEVNKKYLKVLNGEYLKLSDIEFDNLVIQVLEEIKNGNVSFYDYVLLFAMFKYFIDVKLVIYDIEKLYDIFVSGMEKSAKKHIILLSDIRMDNKQYTDEYIKKLKKTEEKILKNMTKSITGQKAEEVFSYIPNDISKFYKEMINEYRNIPILANIDSQVIYHKLTSISNYDLSNIINLIKLRYDNNTTLLKNEKKNLIHLSKLIDDHLSNDKRGIKEILLYHLSSEIKNIV
ncbi:MAG: P-loop NTPase fold protein [Clostridia bacterium]|nr:P-loop NTPase fold protein [Clostridia bacterium]